MENINKGPSFGDFVTILTEGLMYGLHSCNFARLQTTRVQTSSPTSFKSIVLRKSLSVDSQNIPCATLKRRGSWVISVYLWLLRLSSYWRVSMSPATKILSYRNYGQIFCVLNGCHKLIAWSYWWCYSFGVNDTEDPFLPLSTLPVTGVNDTRCPTTKKIKITQIFY